MSKLRARAAILAKLKAPLVLDEIEVPAPARGQVLVKVRVSGLCGSQLGEIEGVKGPDRFLPHLLGHEGSGVVLETGPGVASVAAGDHVVLHWRPGRGLQAEPASYRWRRRKLNAGWVTTFNELAVVSENRVTRVPSDLDPAWAALLGCAVTTGMGVVANDAKVRAGESVVVLGAGGVGLSVLQAAAMASADPVVAVDLSDPKLDLARAFGATHAVNSRRQDARKAVTAIIGPGGADVVVDNTGRVELIELAYELTGPRGRTILVGVPRAGQKARIDTLPLHFGKVLTGSHGGGARPAEDIPRLVRLARDGKLRLDGMVSDRFPLERINEAVAFLRSGKAAGRVLIEVSE